jgi:16S rRNA (guanine(966)-N(2))-methyltransferase RsmD
LESLLGPTGLVGTRFVDLFAGSGAVGIEAASRGADAVLLVESDPRAVRTVATNVTALELGEVCRVRAAKAASVVAAGPDTAFDVVFEDPPYAVSDAELSALHEALLARNWLAPDALLVVERSVRSPAPPWPTQITLERSRRYGESMLWYGRRA